MAGEPVMSIASTIAVKVAGSLIAGRLSGWLKSAETRNAFEKSLAAALTALSEAGYGIEGTGAIDETFLLDDAVISELWNALLDPAVDSEINYSILTGAFDRIWRDQQTFDEELKAKQRASIEFLVDLLYDEFLWHSPLLARNLSAKILRQLDGRLSLYKRRHVIRSYLAVSSRQIQEVQSKLIGDHATYIEPILRKHREKPSERQKSSRLAALDRRADTPSPDLCAEYEDIELNTYLLSGPDLRVVIVGDSGMGKSTLLREVFLRLCQRWELGQFVPLFFTPAQAKACSEGNIKEVICDRLRACETHVRETQLQELAADLVKRGQIAFIIDAVDQVDSPDPLIGYIGGMSLGKNRIIVSTRPSAFTRYENAFLGYSFLRILEFDRSRIETYYGDILSSPGLRRLKDELLGIPIVATVVKDLFANGAVRQEEMINRSDIYHALMRKMPKRQEDCLILGNRDPDDILYNLRRLAFESLKQNNLGQCTREEAKEIIGPHELNILERLQYLMKLIETEEDTLFFRHRSFQEYLAGEALKQEFFSKNGKSDLQGIGKFLFHPNWEEPLRFLAGLLDEKHLARLLRCLLNPEGAPVFLIYQEHLKLVALCLHEAKNVPPTIEKHVLDLIKRLDSDSCIDFLASWGRGKAEDALVQLLENESKRRRIVEILGGVGTDRAVNALAKALEDKDEGVRRVAAEALRKIGSDRAIDALAKALEDKDEGVRRVAAEALRKIGSDRAVDALVKALEDEDKGVRRVAAIALGETGSDRAVDVLVKALEDKDEGVRRVAAIALGETGSDRAVDALVKALEDEDKWVRREAVGSLGKTGSDRAVDALLKALEDENGYGWLEVVRSLRKIGTDRAVDALVKALEDKDGYGRMEVVRVLGEIGTDRAANALAKALEDKNKAVRRGAVRALGKTGSNGSVDALMKAMKDEDESVRLEVVRVLGEMGSDRAFDALVKALEDEDEWVRIEVVGVFRKMEPDRSFDALVKALEDEDKGVRRVAAIALGETGSDRAVDALVKALEDENGYGRLEVVKALGETGSDRSFDALVKALEDEDKGVRRVAAIALGKTGSNRAVDALVKVQKDQDEGVRREAVKALGETESDRAVDALIKALEDEDGYGRLEAVRSLGKIGSDRAVDALMKALKDENEGVRREVVKALGEIGSDRAVDALMKALKDENEGVRREVVKALGEIGSDRAVDALMKALKDRDKGVRRVAAAALGETESDRAVDALVKALKDRDESVWRVAAAALCHRATERSLSAVLGAFYHPQNRSIQFGAEELVRRADIKLRAQRQIA
jgi:HEAT repeat protein